MRLAIRDTRGEPDGAAQAIESLALEEGAIAVIGGVTNAEAERAAAAAEDLAIPFISLSKQDGLTEAGPARLPEHAHRRRPGAGAGRLRHGHGAA